MEKKSLHFSKKVREREREGGRERDCIRERERESLHFSKKVIKRERERQTDRVNSSHVSTVKLG